MSKKEKICRKSAVDKFSQLDDNNKDLYFSVGYYKFLSGMSMYLGLS